MAHRMNSFLKPGVAFWYEGSCDIEHLHVVLNHPKLLPPDMGKTTPYVMCVNVTSIKGAKYDPTVVILPSDWSAITKDSYIHYIQPKLLSEGLLSKLLKDKPCKQTAHCPKGLLRKIQAGMMSSHNTPRSYQKVWEKWHPSGVFDV
jgi:hypothetical protein